MNAQAMLFPLKESTIDVRGRKCVVRELSHKKRAEISKLIIEDKFRGPALWASWSSVDPEFTEDQAGDMPAEVIDALAREGMKLSGFGGKDEGDSPKT